MIIDWVVVCVLSATGFLDEVCARVKALSLFSLAIFFFPPHNSTYTHTQREKERVCSIIRSLGHRRRRSRLPLYTYIHAGWWWWCWVPTHSAAPAPDGVEKTDQYGREGERENATREKAEPSHGGLNTTRMDESERERERERLCSG